MQGPVIVLSASNDFFKSALALWLEIRHLFINLAQGQQSWAYAMSPSVVRRQSVQLHGNVHFSIDFFEVGLFIESFWVGITLVITYRYPINVPDIIEAGYAVKHFVCVCDVG